MINSFSVASSHTASNAGAGAAAITLHFNYNSSSSSNNNHNNNNIKGNINYNNNNNNSGLKILTAPMATSTNEHKSHNTNATTTTAKMFKITQSEVEAKHFLMTYPQQQQKQQQQQQQNKSGGASKWLSPGKVNTSAITKEPQFIQVNNSQSINISNNNNNSSQKSMQTTTTAKPKSAFIGVMSMPQERQQQQKQRTEDQENAFRQIEDVHNYAKLQHHQQQHHLHPHQQSSSSDELCEEEEDDEEDEDDDEEEDRQQQKLKVNVPNNINHNNNHEDSEEHVEVDVVTVTPTTITPEQQQQLQQQEQQQQLQLQQLSAPVADQDMRPEHHARRPMNAFLIFCKRHRAIVKDRYKSLENRAITKILGDWWAALDEQEKQCFTDLAQQNKDAFFNANPNFKWYKLPAPPLRTLATRPSNANSMAHSNDEQQQQQHIHWEPNEVAHMLRRNYFKFADETQMGDLSALLSASAAANVRGDDKDYALQQALSETTQFLSAHMPGNNNNNNNNVNNNNNKIKRSLQPAAAAAAADSASNSSEEEERGSPSKKLKSTRSCKGKIYQELINSGQLAAIAKKSKCRLNSGSSSSCTTDANSSTPPISPTGGGGGANNTMATAGGQLLVEMDGAGGVTSNTGSSSIGDEFDLEEKIKELPALSLDAYLQRKRSTKKKKKFSSSKKQRNSNSNSSNSNATAATAAAKKAAAAMAKKCESVNPAAAAATAVGSQKRKARKESITRRDVSAIEQEVASILPLTINGCYYINQTSQAQRAPQTASSPLSSASSTEQQQPVVYDATSTSDLLILAEVAANRTELSKSN